jgi:hypothetical protein
MFQNDDLYARCLGDLSVGRKRGAWREPMDKNRMKALPSRASGQDAAKLS